MTILGRVLEKGYPQAALSDFSDAASVPAWAKEHVATLVSLEVVGGSNGQLRPSAPSPGRKLPRCSLLSGKSSNFFQKALAMAKRLWYDNLQL